MQPDRDNTVPHDTRLGDEKLRRVCGTGRMWYVIGGLGHGGPSWTQRQCSVKAVDGVWERWCRLAWHMLAWCMLAWHRLAWCIAVHAVQE